MLCSPALATLRTGQQTALVLRAAHIAFNCALHCWTQRATKDPEVAPQRSTRAEVALCGHLGRLPASQQGAGLAGRLATWATYSLARPRGRVLVANGQWPMALDERLGDRVWRASAAKLERDGDWEARTCHLACLAPHAHWPTRTGPANNIAYLCRPARSHSKAPKSTGLPRARRAASAAPSASQT